MKVLLFILLFSIEVISQTSDFNRRFHQLALQFQPNLESSHFENYILELELLSSDIKAATLKNETESFELLSDSLSALIAFTQVFGLQQSKTIYIRNAQLVETVFKHQLKSINHFEHGIKLIQFKCGRYESYLLLNNSDLQLEADYEWKSGNFEGFGLCYLRPGFYTLICSSKDRNLNRFHFQMNSVSPIGN